MSGVLRRGSLNFNCAGSSRGSLDANLNGGYRETKPTPGTPEISVIAMDFRRHSDDLKKVSLMAMAVSAPAQASAPPIAAATTETTEKDLSQDADSDVLSNFLGHYRWWSFFWTFVLCLFQVPTTFHLFMFVFQVTLETHLGELSPMLQSSQSPEQLEQLQLKTLQKLMGTIGRWQCLWCALLSTFQGICTFHIFIYVFQTSAKDYWCARPVNLAQLDIAEWRNLSQTANGCLLRDLDYSQLSYEQGELINWPSNASELGYRECTEFEFSDVDGTARTLVQDFNLVCGNDITNIVETCFLTGAAAGAVLSGWISDRFGRRHTLMAFVSIQTIFGGILAFSTSLAMFMSLRVIIGFASMTVTVVSFVLVVELVSGQWRTIIGILNILPVAITYVLSAGIAYFIRDWRTLQLVISWPWLVMLCIWYWLPESPRWLLAQGRLEELCRLIERAAKMNGTLLPANYQKTLEAAVPRAAQQSPPTEVEGNKVVEESNHDLELELHVNPLVVVFGSKYWRTTVLTLVIWLTLIIIYFGLTLHLSNLGGNIYMNSAVAGTIEAVSICFSIFVVLKAGIRSSLLGYMLLPGLCCLATNLIPQGENNQTGVIALAIVAKCLIGANNAIIPTYTAMQYPTIVRNFGVGMGNLASGIALILVPFLWQLEHFDALLPLNIMGACGLIGAAAIALMKDVE
ncbi:organic cation transporter protein isoform X2 [Drosophila busckii]|uniref:organic cation transporter protein isoform X2 n=1 Tax=Drosophila busckii TaxID=30019 RepID=UPI00083F35F2|nr:organic cation transporter protein isoform X2 [Drosophila busckii]